LLLISELIARDLNHPCIVAWVPFNESFGIRDIDSNTSAQNFVAAVVSDTRALDTSRPVQAIVPLVSILGIDSLSYKLGPLLNQFDHLTN